MEDRFELEACESALAGELAQLAPPEVDPARLRGRLRRARLLAILALVLFGAMLAGAAFVAGGGWLLAGAALVLLLRRARALRGPWDEVAALAGEGELVELEAEHLERRLLHLRLEIAGDVCLALLAAGLAGFRADARLSTWVFRVAIRAALRVRSRRARHAHEPVEACAADARNPGALADPGAGAERRESAARLLSAIARLPAAQRAVLALSALDGLAQTEIAAILGVPAGTVYSRLHAARERLREELAR